MVILLEGVDGTGKSTLMQYLKSVLKESAVFIKESYTPDVLEKQARLQQLDRYADNKDTLFIYDRATAIDEFVYNPIIANEEPQLDYEEARAILQKCFIIYLTCQTDVLLRRLEGRGDEYIVPTAELIESLCMRYDCVLDGLARIDVDTTQSTPKQIGQEVSMLIYHIILIERGENDQ